MSKRWLALAVVIVLVGLINWATAAWTPPSSLPPTCDESICNPPLNVSAEDQAKLGALTLGSASAPLFTLDVPGGSAFFGAGLAVVGDVLFNNTLGIALPGGQLPTAPLDVNGAIKIRGGSPAAGSVLMSADSNGLAAWTTVDLAIPDGPGDSVMQLRTTALTNPPACPAPFTEVGINTVAANALNNNRVRSCYNSSAFCQVLELHSIVAETPAACPGSFTQAQSGTFYLANAINNIRVCYRCHGVSGLPLPSSGDGS
jgi:hypothetical protein